MCLQFVSCFLNLSFDAPDAPNTFEFRIFSRKLQVRLRAKKTTCVHNIYMKLKGNETDAMPLSESSAGSRPGPKD